MFICYGRVVNFFNMIQYVYSTNDIWRRKKAFKSEKARRIFGTSNCPKCGSKYLEKTHSKSASITSKVSLFGERYMTDHVDAEEKLHCLYCGYTWNPYKKK